ncbi:MAG: MFS transporter [Bacterioplanes sp.]|nr:MFS transporter [Bacterioplanes sp.]
MTQRLDSQANATSAPIPGRRLSLFYALYFALLGCIAPFWGLYLQHREFSPEHIGWLMAIMALVRIVAPNVWATWATHFSSALTLIRWAGFCTLACFSAIAWLHGFLGMALVMVGFGFFWSALLPQYETLTLQAVGRQLDRYGRIRVWGSIGFIVAVIALGWLFDHVSIAWLPWVMWLIILGVWLSGWTLTDHSTTEERAQRRLPITPLRWNRVFACFIVMTLLLQVSFGPYYTFFSIYLSSLDYPSWSIGWLWALGVLAEVLLFWRFQRISHWLSWRSWLLVCLLLTALRWWLIAGWAESLSWLILAQLVHAFSFAAMHVLAMQFIQGHLPAAQQLKGQAYYSGLGFGLGSALGAWGSGTLWQVIGAESTFQLAAIIAILAGLVAWFGLPRDAQTDNK